MNISWFSSISGIIVFILGSIGSGIYNISKLYTRLDVQDEKIKQIKDQLDNQDTKLDKLLDHLISKGLESHENN